MSYTFEPDIVNRDCKLCSGKRTVEVIPADGSANDAIVDECPHCLRRDYNRLNAERDRLKRTQMVW